MEKHFIPSSYPVRKKLVQSSKRRCRRVSVASHSRDVLAQQIADVNWLHKLEDGIHRHWRRKNARKRANLAKANGHQNPAPA
jgi:hypothetical protein